MNDDCECTCTHPQGWHYRNRGGCLECGCAVFHRAGCDAFEYPVVLPDVVPGARAFLELCDGRQEEARNE